MNHFIFGGENKTFKYYVTEDNGVFTAICLMPEVNATGDNKNRAIRKLRKKIISELSENKWFNNITQQYENAQELCTEITKYVTNHPECSTSEVLEAFVEDKENDEQVGKVLASLAFLTRQGVLGAKNEEEEVVREDMP